MKIGRTINGRKLYTIPRMIAASVLMMSSVGSDKNRSTELITPVFSKSVCQASVRRRKFIHIGKIKIRTMNWFWLTLLFASIMASG